MLFSAYSSFVTFAINQNILNKKVTVRVSDTFNRIRWIWLHLLWSFSALKASNRRSVAISMREYIQGTFLDSLWKKERKEGRTILTKTYETFFKWVFCSLPLKTFKDKSTSIRQKIIMYILCIVTCDFSKFLTFTFL